MAIVIRKTMKALTHFRFDGVNCYNLVNLSVPEAQLHCVTIEYNSQ